MNNFPIAEKPSKGPILGTIIIVLLIIIGGIYILSSRKAPVAPVGPEVTPTDTTTGATPTNPAPTTDNQFTTPPNTDVSALEQEANGLGADLKTLDQDAK